MQQTQESSSASSGGRSSNRLPGVDGLRAVAALWVVLFHIQAFSQAHIRMVPGFDWFLRSGSTGVSLFLVLSGFCLYLPFAGGRTGRFQSKTFFVRRCRRLLPAYYVSLLAVVLLYIGAGRWLGLYQYSPAQYLWQIVTHVTLLHTLFPGSFYSLNGAYWSLGLEWQLYLGLPLLIWGIRRYGLAKTVAAVILCNIVYRLALGAAIASGSLAAHGNLSQSVLPNQLFGRWAEFAYGMLAAEWYITGRIQRWAKHSRLALLAFLPIGILAALTTGWQLSHLVYGIAFVLLLGIVLADNNIIARLFAWRPLVAIGAMSYSLYLVHQPIVQGLAYFLHAQWHTSPNATFAVLVLLLPVVLGMAWVLFQTVERRSLTSGGQQGKATARWTALLHGRSAATSPAMTGYGVGLSTRGGGLAESD